MRISEVLAGKPLKDVITIRPDATVRELVGLLAEHNIGALVVSEDGDRGRHRLRARRRTAPARGRDAVLDAGVGDHDRRGADLRPATRRSTT